MQAVLAEASGSAARSISGAVKAALLQTGLLPAELTVSLGREEMA